MWVCFASAFESDWCSFSLDPGPLPGLAPAELDRLYLFCFLRKSPPFIDRSDEVWYKYLREVITATLVFLTHN